MEARNDDLLFNVTQQSANGVHGLLEAVFGFLNRRTDFFYQMEPGDKMGFPPGVAESMVYQYFKKYQDQHFKKFPYKPELEQRWKKHHEDQERLAQEQKAKKEEQANAIPDSSNQSEVPPVSQIEEEKKSSQASQQTSSSKPVEQKQKPEPKPQVEIDPKMSRISTYNGDVTDKYSWSQGIREVTMQIDLPPGTKARDLDIKIKAKHLSVSFKNKPQEPAIVEGELCEKVNTEDSMWSIEDSKNLVIHFEKAYEAIWKCVVLGDQEIDPKTVDNSKKIEEFDLETQGHLQKVLYEQERKKQGLLTTEEEEQRKLMEKVWNSDNSPFKGLPYDPKKYGQNTGNNGPSPPFNM